MRDYTPTDREVEVAFMLAAGHRTFHGERRQAYQRWLAEVKAEAMETGYNLGFVDGIKQSKAEAWDEGYEGCYVGDKTIDNPYREVSK